MKYAKTFLFVGCFLLTVLPSPPVHAETVTWDRQAFGQLEGECTPGDTNTDWFWPDNNNWSQSQVIGGDPCNPSVMVETQPSNWNTPGYPNGEGVDVILGDMGASGTLADVAVTINSVTILPTGALTIGSINFQAYGFDFEGDGVMGQSGNDLITLLDGGWMEKSGGTNEYVIEPPVLITDGTIEVDSGTLVLSGSRNFTCSNGTFNVSNNSVLDLTGGTGAVWSGEMTGSGGGHVLFASGTIISPGLDFDFPANYFWWTGGSLGSEGQGSSDFTNSGAMTIFTEGSPTLSAGTLYNEGLVLETNAGSLNDGVLQNDVTGTYQLAGDCSVAPAFFNYGLIRKSSGTGNSVIGNFYNEGGAIEADSGTLTLAGGNSSSNGTFNVEAGAVVDLTGGARPTWAGTIMGSGAGQVMFTSGELNVPSTGLNFNFSPGLFWWTGGDLDDNQATNLNAITIWATNSPGMGVSELWNQGMMLQTNGGNFGIYVLVNQPSATYEFGGDGGSTTGVAFSNYGLLRKGSGSGTSTMGCALNNNGGTIEADSGTLSLANNGNSSNGTFIVGANAVVDLTGDGYQPTWGGTMTGSGVGQVVFDAGEIVVPSTGLNLNFPLGLLWWTGGSFGGVTGQYFTNSGSITIWPTNGPSVGYVILWNQGRMLQTNFGNFSVGALALYNQSSGTYEFDGDGSVSGAQLANYGLMRKRYGAGTSVVTCSLNNNGGTIEADSGTLALANSGTSSNGTFIVCSNAVVDLTGGNYEPTWGGTMTGCGAGHVMFDGGEIVVPSTGLNLNFPPGVFWWTGGNFAGTTGQYFTNLGSITIWPTNGPTVGYDFLWNQAIIRQTNAGTFSLGAFGMVNQPSGTYEFDGDGGALSGGTFYNYGLLRKHYGTGASAMNSSLANVGGTIEVDSGTISVPSGFSSGGGALTIALGGYGAGQCGQLLVNGSATLNGTLKVILTNNFAPAVSNQFQIVACSGLSGAFTSLNIPSGFGVTYTSAGVYLVVLPPPVTIQSPQLVNGNFSFAFATESNQSYTIQQNSNLDTANWVYYTNLTGNGSVMQVVSPVTNPPVNFFRVREP